MIHLSFAYLTTNKNLVTTIGVGLRSDVNLHHLQTVTADDTSGPKYLFKNIFLTYQLSLNSFTFLVKAATSDHGMILDEGRVDESGSGSHLVLENDMFMAYALIDGMYVYYMYLHNLLYSFYTVPDSLPYYT